MNLTDATGLALQRFRIRRKEWNNFSLFYDEASKQLKHYGCNNQVSLSVPDILATDYEIATDQKTFKDLSVGSRFKMNNDKFVKINKVKAGPEGTEYNALMEAKDGVVNPGAYKIDDTAIVDLIL